MNHASKPIRLLCVSLTMVIIVGAAGRACAQDYLPADLMPEQFKDVGIDEHPNAQLPLDATFKDSTGKQVELGDYFQNGKPVLMALVYFRCPVLCSLVINGMMNAAKQIDWTPGPDNQYQIVVISFDPTDTPDAAARKKQVYVEEFGRSGAGAGIHFLTGEQGGIDRVTQAIGFNYKLDEKTKEFVHAASIYVVTPDGRMSKYLENIQYEPRTVRLALVEASNGQIGTIGDQILLLCCSYDPLEGSYAASAMKIMNVSAPGIAAGILVILGVIVYSHRKKMKLEKK